jgi:hypothetical protein
MVGCESVGATLPSMASWGRSCSSHPLMVSNAHVPKLGSVVSVGHPTLPHHRLGRPRETCRCSHLSAPMGLGGFQKLMVA